MSARTAATGLLVLAAASLLLLASPVTASRALKSETPGQMMTSSQAWMPQAGRRLRQEDAPQGEPVTTSRATRWCISLDKAAPNAITLAPHEWDVSDWAAPPGTMPAAG
jgi:hypothetical protein